MGHVNKLLIGYDGSPCAEAALEELSRVGLPPELEALVLSVAEVWLPANPDPAPSEFPPAPSVAARLAREQALQAVASSHSLATRAAEQLRVFHPKWRIAAEAAADSPGWALVRKAAEWRADLVLVGSHGRGVLERLFLGSVSQKVAAEAPCSVHIARPRRHTHHARLRVVVAVDGSSESIEAVASVSRRIWPPFTEFHLVAVIDPRLESSFGWPGAPSMNWANFHDQDLRVSVHRMIETAARRLHGAGLAVDTFVLHGDPKDQLLAHAASWESDFIFIGARGLHHGGRLALGTTASALAARAHCSVEITRPC